MVPKPAFNLGQRFGQAIRQLSAGLSQAGFSASTAFYDLGYMLDKRSGMQPFLYQAIAESCDDKWFVFNNSSQYDGAVRVSAPESVSKLAKRFGVRVGDDTGQDLAVTNLVRHESLEG